MIPKMILLILVNSLLISSAISCGSKRMVDNDTLGNLDKQLEIIKITAAPAVLKETEEILNRISTRGFFIKTKPASGRGHAKKILVNTDEVKFLVENAEISLPLIYERLVSNKWKWTERILSVYFIVLEKTKNPESLPYLIDYLRKVPLERDVRHPPDTFYYAVDAVLEFTGPTKEIPFADLEYRPEPGWSNRTAFDNRIKLADDAKEWYDNYKKKK